MLNTELIEKIQEADILALSILHSKYCNPDNDPWKLWIGTYITLSYCSYYCIRNLAGQDWFHILFFKWRPKAIEGLFILWWYYTMIIEVNWLIYKTRQSKGVSKQRNHIESSTRSFFRYLLCHLCAIVWYLWW
jgi:hypothetical protein